MTFSGDKPIMGLVEGMFALLRAFVFLPGFDYVAHCCSVSDNLKYKLQICTFIHLSLKRDLR